MRPWRSPLNSPIDNPSAGGSSGAISAQIDVTASRAVDGTVYHNATTKPIFVIISATIGTNATLQGRSDNTITPSQLIAIANNGGNVSTLAAEISFWVIAGNYYSATTAAGSVTLIKWIEYT